MTEPPGAYRFVLATANPHKAAEIRAILATGVPGLELVARPAELADVVETGATLEENARLKAHALVDATGMAAIADDSGLEVDALDGAPGVRSARYAGEGASDAENCAKLLDALADVAVERRGARFSTVALVRWPDGVEVAALGSVEGRIADAPRGDGGFGYDPVFVPVAGDGRTFGEMSPADKQAHSHRGEAFGELARCLVAMAEGGAR